MVNAGLSLSGSGLNSLQQASSSALLYVATLLVCLQVSLHVVDKMEAESTYGASKWLHASIVNQHMIVKLLLTAKDFRTGLAGKRFQYLLQSWQGRYFRDI